MLKRRSFTSTVLGVCPLGMILLGFLTGELRAENEGTSLKPDSGVDARQPEASVRSLEDPVVVAALEVLRDECVSCHRAGKSKGGLKLTSLESLRAGGESGPAFVEGKVAESLLSSVLEKAGDPHMPPKKQLSATQIEAVRIWIERGPTWIAAVMDRPPKVSPVKLRAMPQAVAPVLALAFSPDGSRLAVGRGGSVEIRDAKKERFPVVQKFVAHVDSIQSIAWSSDGRSLATGAFRAVRFWNADDGGNLGKIEEGLVGDIGSMAVSKDGLLLWTGDSIPSRAGFLRAFDWGSKKEVKLWKAHDDSLLAVSLSSDGKWIASGGADKMVKRWDVASGTLAATYEGHTNHVLGVAFDAETSRIATTSADREIKVWDVPTREQDAVLGDKKQVYASIAWSADGKALAGVTDRGNGNVFTAIQKHDGAQRSETSKVLKLEKVEASLQTVAVTFDGSWIAAGSADGRLFVWKGSDGKAQPADESFKDLKPTQKP